MARNYNMYEYGTSPRKLQPEYAPQRKRIPQTNRPNPTTKKQPTETQKKRKLQQQKLKQQKKKQQRKAVMIIGIGFLILFAISYRNSKIDEQFSGIQNYKNELELIEKENEQLKVNIENGSNLNNLEQSAKELLGMQKLTGKQSVYVTLPKVDYIE